MTGSTITSRRLKVNWIQNHWIQNQDAAITTADLRLGTRSVGSLAAGAVSSATTSVTIPPTVAAGTYYVGAVADYANTAQESNETNNARVGNVITVQ